MNVPPLHRHGRAGDGDELLVHSVRYNKLQWPAVMLVSRDRIFRPCDNALRNTWSAAPLPITTPPSGFNDWIIIACFGSFTRWSISRVVVVVRGPFDRYRWLTPWFRDCRWQFISWCESTVGDGEAWNRHELHRTSKWQCSGRKCWIHSPRQRDGREHDPRQRIWRSANV
jgi:hypothetical protein